MTSQRTFEGLGLDGFKPDGPVAEALAIANGFTPSEAKITLFELNGGLDTIPADLREGQRAQVLSDFLALSRQACREVFAELAQQYPPKLTRAGVDDYSQLQEANTLRRAIINLEPRLQRMNSLRQSISTAMREAYNPHVG